jgi:hypothetical protein
MLKITGVTGIRAITCDRIIIGDFHGSTSNRATQLAYRSCRKTWCKISSPTRDILDIINNQIVKMERK